MATTTTTTALESAAPKAGNGQQPAPVEKPTELTFPTFSSFFGESVWPPLKHLQEEIEQVFARFFPETITAAAPSADTAAAAMSAWTWAPKVDISETDKAFSIEAELPGVKPEDIIVEVKDGVLWLCAETRKEEETTNEGDKEQQQRTYYRRERRYGRIERVFPLPANVREEEVACTFTDGVLTCTLPKKQVEPPLAQGRRIPIQAAAQK